MPEPAPERTRFRKWCRRCRHPFDYAPDERPPLIRLCDECRADLEAEAKLNEINTELPDDALIAAIDGIAEAERRMAEHGAAAARARDVGNLVGAIRHRDRMVAASRRKRAILEAAA